MSSVEDCITEPAAAAVSTWPRRIAVGSLGLTMSLWVAAVVLPVWEVRSDHGQWRGVAGSLPALIGCLGLIVMCPAWFANLVLIPACLTLFIKTRRLGFILSCTAFAVALTAYACSAIYGDNEKDLIVARKLGFYLWLGSCFLPLLGHVLQSTWDSSVSKRNRWTTLCVLFLCVFVLERLFPVGISPR